jgi:MoxR-like ATPase
MPSAHDTDPSMAFGQTAPVTLRQAATLIRAMAHEQSFLLLAPPGVGKSDIVFQVAREAGLPCRSLLGTQIAPEDVSGVPRIVGERSVFCPPRALLPENAEPFCLFLDELPACAPDVQKAFYSLLLERRIGEFALPRGTWVVAAGNRMQDRALVRAMSSALVNRVTILHVRVDTDEWLQWAAVHGVRPEIRRFVASMPESLVRPVPEDPVPFSTPRAWAALSRSLDLAESAGVLDATTRRALAFGRLSPEDAARRIVDGMERRQSRIWVPGWVRAMHWLRALLHLPQAERALRQAAPELERIYLGILATEGAAASSYAPRELQRARERDPHRSSPPVPPSGGALRESSGGMACDPEKPAAAGPVG